MLQNLTIEGFRGFKHFKMGDLGRINLLVGTNNSGKTSILEAIEILTTDSASAIMNTLHRRNELIDFISAERKQAEGDVCHLFYGHSLEIGNEFKLKANNVSIEGVLSVSIAEMIKQDLLESLRDEDDYGEVAFEGSLRRLLVLKSTGLEIEDEGIPLSQRGGLVRGRLHERRVRKKNRKVIPNTRFVTTSFLPSFEIVRMFDKISLTDDEELVIQTLQTIEPNIERIVTISKGDYYPLYGVSYHEGRGGFMVKCDGSDQRIPIGSFGDGIWRMLGLALSLVHARDGILLIDEIDTGLHYSVMADMWKMVNETAKRLNVQVFATTHSQDAVNSLASIAREDRNGSSEVTIQRIERDKQRAVSFSEKEIVVASERGIEVR